MGRIKMKQVLGLGNVTVEAAIEEFLKNCRLRNLSPKTIRYYEEDLQYFARNISAKNADEIFDKASDFYPIHNQTPLIIEDTSKMYLTSVKPFNFGDEATFQADLLNFSFPGNADNYMTCTTGPSKCEHSFAVEETQLADGKYKLSVLGRKLPASMVSHSWGPWISNGDATHTRECTLNEAHAKETLPCCGGQATSQRPAICVDCGAGYGELLLPYPSAIPNTGDSANLILWTALMATSIIGMLLMRRKKHKKYPPLSVAESGGFLSL